MHLVFLQFIERVFVRVLQYFLLTKMSNIFCYWCRVPKRVDLNDFMYLIACPFIVLSGSRLLWFYYYYINVVFEFSLYFCYRNLRFVILHCFVLYLCFSVYRLFLNLIFWDFIFKRLIRQKVYEHDNVLSDWIMSMYRKKCLKIDSIFKMFEIFCFTLNGGLCCQTYFKRIRGLVIRSNVNNY